MLACGGHLSSVTRRAPVVLTSLSLIISTAACGEDFGTDPPPGPSGETWSRSFGDEAAQTITSVAVDELGGVYVTGGFSGTTDFGGGPLVAAGTSEDLFVAKYDTDGDHVWSRRFGDTGNQRGTGIDVGPGGEVVVTGNFTGSIDLADAFLQSSQGSDIFLITLEGDGSTRGGSAFVGAGLDSPTGLVVDGGGNIIIGGYFDGDVAFGGELLFSAGEDDIFLAKFLPGGEHVWSYRFGDVADDRLWDVAVDGQGNVGIAGTVGGGVVDLGGGGLDPGGGVDSDDAIVASYSPNGAHRWSRRLGDDSVQRARGVAFDPVGDMLVAGEFGGTIDFGGQPRTSTGGVDAFVVKYDSSGNPRLSNAYGVVQNQSGRRVASGGNGDIFLAGTFDGAVSFGGAELQSAGDDDIFVARLDPGAVHQGSSAFGDLLMQSVADLTVDGAGHAIVVGNFNGTIDFGFGPHGTSDDAEQNPFIAKLMP